MYMMELYCDQLQDLLADKKVSYLHKPTEPCRNQLSIDDLDMSIAAKTVNFI